MYLYLLVVFHRYSIIKILDVKCAKLGTRCGHCAVEYHFGSYQSCTLCYFHALKFQYVSSHSETYAMVFRLVWYDFCNNSDICDRFTIGKCSSGNEENGIVPF